MEAVALIVAGLIIILGLMQNDPNEGIASAFTGSTDLSLFNIKKERGSDKVMVLMTYGLGAVLFAVIILMKVMV